MRYFTYKRAALKAKRLGQKLRFRKGRGYWLSGKIRRKPKPQPITMYDSIDVAQIPRDAVAAAGYVNGRWPTFSRLGPHKHRLSIAVSASANAECLDVEKGDATISQAPAWVKRQLKRGVKRPVVYTSVSRAPALLRALSDAGIRVKRAKIRRWLGPQIRLWTAHYTFHPHICSKECGFGDITADATQYHDHALGKNLDASLVSPTFF